MDFKLIKSYKKFSDILYSNIYISNLALEFIDSAPFQRLRKINQLGVASLVFNCASHKRFEHSVGTYHLAGKILDSIKRTSHENIKAYLKQIPDLKKYYSKNEIELDDYICELIKIAALCHDIGHGPFSHLFDDVINNVDHPNKTHEVRSQIIIEDIINNNVILSKVITKEEVIFIKNIIFPKNINTGFIYQIVSNNYNGLDVDKYDYIVRDSYMFGNKIDFDYCELMEQIKVIDNIICYQESSLYQIVKMYNTRYGLHKEKYIHKSVISAQYLILEIIKNLDPIIKITESIYNLEKFYQLTDDYILNAVYFIEKIDYENKYQENIKNIKIILELLNTHTLYPLVGKKICDKEINLCKENLKDIKNYENKYEDDLLIFNTKIGYVSGNKKNPLKHLYGFNNSSDEKIKINTKNISYLIPKVYQEYVTYIFYKKINDKQAIEKLRHIFNNF